MMSNTYGLSLALAVLMLLGQSRSGPGQTLPAAVRWPSVVTMLNQLPSDVRKKIGTDNPQHVFAKTNGSVRP